MALAIAAYERTIEPGMAPFDRWVEGDETAISDAAKRGFALFNGKANCFVCHSGWRFTNDSFHDIGVATKDPGRGRAVKDDALMQFAFKTPTLRSVAAPAVPARRLGRDADRRDQALRERRHRAPEPLGRPEPEPLIAAREGLEPDPLVVNELPLESLFALVERRHGRASCRAPKAA